MSMEEVHLFSFEHFFQKFFLFVGVCAVEKVSGGSPFIRKWGEIWIGYISVSVYIGDSIFQVVVGCDLYHAVSWFGHV